MEQEHEEGAFLLPSVNHDMGGHGKKRGLAVGHLSSDPGSLEPCSGHFTALSLGFLIIKLLNQLRYNQMQRPLKKFKSLWKVCGLITVIGCQEIALSSVQ